MIVFAHPHQDPSSAVLYVLQSLDGFAGDPDEELIAIVKPGRDKGMDELLCICQGEGGAEFFDVPKMVESCLGKVFYVGLQGEVGVHLHAQVSDCSGEGDGLAGEGDGGYGG